MAPLLIMFKPVEYKLTSPIADEIYEKLLAAWVACGKPVHCWFALGRNLNVGCFVKAYPNTLPRSYIIYEFTISPILISLKEITEEQIFEYLKRQAIYFERSLEPLYDLWANK